MPTKWSAISIVLISLMSCPAMAEEVRFSEIKRGAEQGYGEPQCLRGTILLFMNSIDATMACDNWNMEVQIPALDFPDDSSRLDQGMEWVRKSAENGFAPAAKLLADLYAHADSNWLLGTSDDDADDYKYNNADLFERIKNEEEFAEHIKDNEKAVKWYHRTAEMEKSKARSRSYGVLGTIYYRGLLGVRRDYEKALYWYERFLENVTDPDERYTVSGGYSFIPEQRVSAAREKARQ